MSIEQIQFDPLDVARSNTICVLKARPKPATFPEGFYIDMQISWNRGTPKSSF